MTKAQILAALALSALAGCAQTASEHGGAQNIAPAMLADGVTDAVAAPARSRATRGALLGGGKIQHVVIIFQENRSTDDLFNGLPGADTVTSGSDTGGGHVNLQRALLTAPFDVDHSHIAFNTAYDGGLMDGFNLETSNCSGGRHACVPEYLRPYGYVPQTEVQPYFTMAEQYAFGDRMFASQAGPSFPAHQYIISGTSTISQGSTLRASENPLTPQQKFTGGCDSPKGSLGDAIDESGTEDQEVFPCFDRPVLMDLLKDQGMTWRYYQEHRGSALWNGPDAIKHIRYGSQYKADVVWPPSEILNDITRGDLATVSWVTPTAAASDHAGHTDGSGPDWVASVVNAVGESKYWDSTAIIVTWDDWGGWYDHVKPPQYNSYELGFRVPLVVIGAYAKSGYVSHKQHEFGSILKFAEKTLGLGSLGTTDVRADDLADCFNFNQKPRAFTPIQTQRGRQYFLSRPVSYEDVDDE
jgi:phospholipase C